jgi:hypothetical protein
MKRALAHNNNANIWLLKPLKQLEQALITGRYILA